MLGRSLFLLVLHCRWPRNSSVEAMVADPMLDKDEPASATVPADAGFISRRRCRCGAQRSKTHAQGQRLPILHALLIVLPGEQFHRRRATVFTVASGQQHSSNNGTYASRELLIA